MIHPADILFPCRCAFCAVKLPVGSDGVCEQCAKKLPYTEPDRMLRKVGDHTCAVTFYYEKNVPQAIYSYKFNRRTGRAAVFARYLAATVSETLGGEFDAVTYVPISFQRRRIRGFDQSRLLARHCCCLWGVKLQRTLGKIRNNPPQSSVKTKKERRSNVQGVYRVLPKAEVAGRRFLIIDDITTSGNTLAACADLLLEAGAASVVCAVLAGARRDEPL